MCFFRRKIIKRKAKGKEKGAKRYTGGDRRAKKKNQNIIRYGEKSRKQSHAPLEPVHSLQPYLATSTSLLISIVCK